LHHPFRRPQLIDHLDLEAIDTLDRARPAWEQLEDASGNPFATWAWADAWWPYFGGGRRLHLRQVRDPSGRVVVVLPLYAERRGPVTLLRFLGHGPADQLGPVCAPEHRGLAAQALRRVVRRTPGCLLLADRLAVEEGVGPLLGGRVVRHESSPLVSLRAPSWDAWLGERSSNFRGQVRRRERKAVRDHGLTFRLSDDVARVPADLETLFELHEARWQGASTAFTPQLRAFHHDFALRALRSGRLRLWFAEIADRPVAAWYGLRIGAAEWYYQAGRDPAWDEQGIGSVLLAHTIRSALETGATVYRFGLGDEPYKARFSTDDPGIQTVVSGPGPFPALAEHGATLVRRLPSSMRSAVAERAT
jgi:CelD/BcsL family acetyltransferase involved in cellulose biosynthesis